MKITTLLLIWALGIMPIFCQAQVTVQVIENKNKQEELPLYNLYYLSKFLSSTGLTDEQRTQVYSSLYSLIGIEKLKNLNQSIYPNISNFLTSRENSKSLMMRTYEDLLKSGSFILFKEIEKIDKPDYNTDLKNDYFNLENSYSVFIKNVNTNNYKLSHLTSTLGLLRNKEKNTEFISKITDTIKNDKNILKIIYKNSLYTKQNKLDSINIFSIDSIQIKKNITDFNDKISREKADYENRTRIFVTKLVNKKFEFREDIDMKPLLLFQSERTEQSQNQININSFVQNAQKDLSYSGLSLPSESQMIEAMAIFLANRAKQEAAIWFMDEIRSRMNNPLIYDAFPETIKLIDHLQDYQTPNFSSSWRYAISSDFVKMPINIASSSWVKDVIIKDPTNASNLETGVNFGYDINRLMAERYNYRDIIRHFYINPYQINASVDKTKSIIPVLNTSFVSLYIITNELFVIDNKDANKKYRLLSYEEISSLSLEQWNVLIELMRLKYSEKFSNNEIWKKLNEKEIASKWIGNLLISLSQFDKINMEQQILREQNKLESTDQSFYSVWKILEQVINNINYEQFVNLNSQQKFQIELLKNSVSIYEDLQLKNFIAAAQKTLNLIDSYNDLKNFEKESSYIIINKNIKIDREDHNNFDNFSINIIKTDKEIKKGTIVFDGKNIKIEDENNVKLFEVNEFSKISSFANYLDNKNDTYNLAIEALSTKKDNLNREIRSIARKLGINEAQFIQIINYAFLLNKEKDPKKIDLKNTLRSFASFTIENKDQLISKYNGKYTEQLYKLTSFLGDVMTAKDKNELANVIDSHALPPTSYKLKRRMAWSIDLNSFVGAYGGYIQPSTGSSLDPKWTGGIAATIGIAVTESHKFLGLRNKGLVIDLVDLGNIVNHYLVSPNVDYDKDVHFSEVFSPGVSFIAAIGNTPLVFSAGVKFLPLKAVRLDNNEVINGKFFDATIFNVGLKIDIPLVNLYSKDFSK